MVNIKAEKIPNRKLNICLVSREYPPETGWGGIGTYVYHLAHGLSELGHNVHVIAQSLDADRDYLDKAVFVHRIAHKNFFYFKGPLREFSLRLEYSFSVYKKIKSLIKEHNLDIVEGQNFSAETFVFSLLKTIPLVVRLHTHFSEVIRSLGWRRTPDYFLSCWLENINILRSDLVISSTKSHAKIVFDDIGAHPQKTRIIPLAVPLPILDKNQGKDKQALTVLFTGRLERRKGIHVLMEAIPLVLREFPSVIFNIIGKDTQKNLSGAKLNTSIPKEYAQKVSFLGYVTEEELRKYYASCDVFVAPSLYESCGLVYIEAMSYAKPVIGCSVGGVPEVIRHNDTGLLICPEDARSLSKAIIRLLQDPQLRRKMGDSARREVENRFSLRRMIEETLEAYKNVIKENTDESPGFRHIPAAV